eukprot:CAMPEP_0170507942 /NCGR_PEP_ID=MMETSP0208-20121228/60644_1 /TAXON_ID=197538 /ORGANISM="Strombidium inclinatum, Strain S3" /LENGTH=97 /DNA_ID=CAMNT_0010790497 /DNA_START=456 /DNA_END=748 /DNA_ORIENTATION=+
MPMPGVSQPAPAHPEAEATPETAAAQPPVQRSNVAGQLSYQISKINSDGHFERGQERAWPQGEEAQLEARGPPPIAVYLLAVSPLQEARVRAQSLLR